MKKLILCCILLSGSLFSMEYFSNENSSLLPSTFETKKLEDILDEDCVYQDTICAHSRTLSDISALVTHEKFKENVVRKITVMSFKNNLISSVPKEISRFENVVHLDLSYNQLKEIPDSISALTNLTNLNLEHNQIVRLPTSLSTLENLAILLLSHNRLTEIPSLVDCKKLEIFEAANNKLVTLCNENGELLLPVGIWLCNIDNNNIPTNEMQLLKQKSN
ncbi:MAG: leucine-rich repeat domain-containing protein [Candidatus Dependentiae bacterium]